MRILRPHRGDPAVASAGRSRPSTSCPIRGSARSSRRLSNWPTIPQLFIDGELVGGCDIVTEMYESGELQQALGVEDDAPTSRPGAGAARSGAAHDREPLLATAPSASRTASNDDPARRSPRRRSSSHSASTAGRYGRSIRPLPGRSVELALRTADDVADALRRLAIRGAPLIGVAAGYGLALEVARGSVAGIWSAPARCSSHCPAHRGQPGSCGRSRARGCPRSDGSATAAALAEALAIDAEERGRRATRSPPTARSFSPARGGSSPTATRARSPRPDAVPPSP